MSERGKLAGGAAVGAGGILAVLLKSGSAELHAVEGVTQAARATRAAEGVGQVGVRAGEGVGQAGLRAGEGVGQAGARAGAAGVEGVGGARGVAAGVAGAAEHGLPSIERASLASASDLSLTPIDVTAHAGDPARGATRLGAPAAKNAGAATKATRAQKVHDALEHADDAKELLERLNDVWDLSQPLDDDEDEKVAAKFQAKGLDFRGDVVPSFKGEPVIGLDGARRALLTDGHGLVPAFKLPGFPAETRRLERGDRYDAVLKINGQDPSVALFAEPVDDATAKTRPTGTLLIYSLAGARDMTWQSIPAKDLRVVPRVLDIGDKRYASVVPAPIHRTSPVTQLIVVTREGR
jgi:hypothetical protein